MLLTPTDLSWSADSIQPRYHASHDFLMFLYSNVVGRLKEMKSAGVFSVGIDSTKLADDEIGALYASDDPIAFLQEHELIDELKQTTYISVVTALISDFCSSLFELMHLTARGKTGVAFQLLRKSVMDTLFHMEWILADTDDYIERFNSGDPKKLQHLSVFGTKEKRIELFQKASKHITSVTENLPEALVELRYERDSDSGLYCVMQQALHLVTTKYSKIATEPYNLNFVFSDKENVNSQQDRLYRTLPYLTDYFRELALTLLDRIATRDKESPTYYIDKARKLSGLALHRKIHIDEPDSEESVAREVSKVLAEVAVECNECGKRLDPLRILNPDELQIFMFHGLIKCHYCYKEYWPYEAAPRK